MDISALQLNPLKQKLAAGSPVIGMWSIVPSALLSEILGLAGLDFLILDMEHGPYDLSVLAACVQACEGAGCSPLVRVPGPNQFTIQSVLDLGIHGLVVPQINDAVSTLEAIRCMKFPPAGVRGYNPFTRAAAYAKPANNRAGKLNDAFTFKSIIVESREAIKDINSILDVDDLDMVYIGVYDLAVSMGHAGDTQHPEVRAALDETVRKIRDRDKAAGMMVLAPQDIARALSSGANFLVYSVDGHFIHQAAATVVQSLRTFSAKG